MFRRTAFLRSRRRRADTNASTHTVHEHATPAHTERVDTTQQEQGVHPLHLTCVSGQYTPPDVLKSLPARLQQRILAIWEERDPKGDCWQQQRRTRLVLLNLPPSLRKSLRPPALECALPHFIDRLEWDLQVKLRRLWTGYKKGQPCSKLVAKQLRLLQQHDISLESFDMPPATMFRRYQVIQKLKQTNLL
ncbi:unnamed protein product [Heligmosomoides polygyrus]|uniref:SOCS box domain-containing protein n=1 Tax=Heligmosomoides polygyrus TaxID=6339 RepID=A0A183FLC2_HELPZ|nr:unnamed protein product [Heligmosomoides polygyrus]